MDTVTSLPVTGISLPVTANEVLNEENLKLNEENLILKEKLKGIYETEEEFFAQMAQSRARYEALQTSTPDQGRLRPPLKVDTSGDLCASLHDGPASLSQDTNPRSNKQVDNSSDDSQGIIFKGPFFANDKVSSKPV